MDERRIIINLVKKVLKIFSINIDLDVSEIHILEDKKINKFLNKIEISDKYLIDLALSVSSKKGYKTYYLIKPYDSNTTKYRLKFKDINFIFENCRKVFRALFGAYISKSITSVELSGCLDETIELSIISLALKKKQPNGRSDYLVEAVSLMIQQLNKWSNRTYEGRKIPFSFLINLNKVETDNIRKIASFLEDDASALITDGISSYIEVSDKIFYKVASHYDAENTSTKQHIPLVTYRFSSFGNICDDNSLGIVLTVQGDILFIQDTKLIFGRRNGDWHAYDYDSFSETLFKDMPQMRGNSNRKIRMIYLTCLDVAFARTGGCLAICNKRNLDKIRQCVNNNDLHKDFSIGERTDYHNKRFILEKVVSEHKNFNAISRKARQELLGIDGATVILTDGAIVTTGAIMNNEFNNESNDLHGGARTKIAMKLSDYGIAIKISADGYIECYKNQKNIY